MSWQATTWVIKNSQHKGSELLLMIMIANYAHPDGSNAYASLGLLADDCRMHIRAVRRLLHRLEDSGELTINRSAGRNPHRFAINMNPDNMTGLNPDTVTAGLVQPQPGQYDRVEPGQFEHSTRTPRDATRTNGACHIRNRTHEPMNPKRGDKSTKGIESNGDASTKPPSPPFSASPASEPGPAYRKLSDLCRISLPATERENSWLRAALSDLRKKMQADTDSNPEGDPVNSRMACQALEVLFAFWKSQDWRGKQGDAPSPAQLIESYGAAKVWARN